MNNYFSKHHLNDEALALCAEALVAGKEDDLPVMVRNHVEKCMLCRAEIFSVYDLIKDADTIKEHENQGSLNHISNQKCVQPVKTNRYKMWWSIAAAFLFLAGIGGLIYYITAWQPETILSDNRPALYPLYETDVAKNNVPAEDEEYPGSDRLAKSVQKDKYLAADMQESKTFEYAIISHYRNFNIEVLSPGVNQQYVVNQPIVFKFEGNVQGPLVVVIYNNKGEEIFCQEHILSIGFTLGASLPSGLYYWKAERNKTLLYLGKFIVK